MDLVSCAGDRGKTVAILQSNYVPWKGYFDIIHSVDEFILYDEVQYTTGDWRNRNLIKRPDGRIAWITIPIFHRGHLSRRISEAMVADPFWSRNHSNKIHDCYRNAPFYLDSADRIHGLYGSLAEEELLSRVNYRLIKSICDVLRIFTKISWSTDYPGEGGQTERLVSICQMAGANAYLSGPSARNYLDQSLFAKQGIKVEWMRYEYPEYPQTAGPFTHQVSILDLLFNTGPQAADFIWGSRQRRVA